MKVVILAGGLGTRLGEETQYRPKPMVEVGGQPILWHIMKLYGAQGFNEFVLLLGYKSHMIKDYFLNYHMHNSDFTVDLTTDTTTMHTHTTEPWKVTLVDTGLESGTAQRLLRAKAHLQDAPFMLTYGDGVSDIDLKALQACHAKAGRMVTITSVQPEGRFGKLEIDGNDGILGFAEKPIGDGAWINGGFMVMNPEVFQHLPTEPDAMLEPGLLEPLAAKGQLQAYRHKGFWHAMDSLRDNQNLQKYWASGKAPWKLWGETPSRPAASTLKKAV